MTATGGDKKYYDLLNVLAEYCLVTGAVDLDNFLIGYAEDDWLVEKAKKTHVQCNGCRFLFNVRDLYRLTREDGHYLVLCEDCSNGPQAEGYAVERLTTTAVSSME